MFGYHKKQFGNLLCLCMVGVLFLAGCGKDAGEQEKVTKGGTLVMGTSADLPPFEFYRTNGHQTEIVGFDIDVAKSVGDHLNKEIRVQDMDFSSLIAALKAGRVDFVMASMTPTEERQKSVDFSTIYLRLPTAILTKKGALVKDPKDLKNHKVGVQLGSSHAEVLNQFKQQEPSIEGIALNKVGELVQELLSGRITAIIMESKAGEAFAQNNPGLQVNIIKDYDVIFAIAFAKGSPLRDQINTALEHLKKQGSLEKLKEKWFKPPAQ